LSTRIKTEHATHNGARPPRFGSLFCSALAAILVLLPLGAEADDPPSETPRRERPATSQGTQRSSRPKRRVGARARRLDREDARAIFEILRRGRFAEADRQLKGLMREKRRGAVQRALFEQLPSLVELEKIRRALKALADPRSNRLLDWLGYRKPAKKLAALKPATPKPAGGKSAKPRRPRLY